MGLRLHPLYAIIDRESLDARGFNVGAFAGGLREAGVRMVQYRDKRGSPQQVLAAAAEIKSVFEGAGAMLILNDRADLAVLAGWSGVHVGHTDMTPEAVRAVLGGGDSAAPCGIIGVSTHDAAQLRAAEAGAADYVAVGPVFATASKADTEPVVGLDGVRMARELTTKPLVAIGGITRENAASVIAAGADAVAVIGALLPAEGRSVREQVEAMLGAFSV